MIKCPGALEGKKQLWPLEDKKERISSIDIVSEPCVLVKLFC